MKKTLAAFKVASNQGPQLAGSGLDPLAFCSGP
jgi:hypothetical protein